VLQQAQLVRRGDSLDAGTYNGDPQAPPQGPGPCAASWGVGRSGARAKLMGFSRGSVRGRVLVWFAETQSRPGGQNGSNGAATVGASSLQPVRSRKACTGKTNREPDRTKVSRPSAEALFSACTHASFNASACCRRCPGTGLVAMKRRDSRPNLRSNFHVCLHA
jgi:hypothetical protein